MKYESSCYDELLLQTWLWRIDKKINLYLSDNWRENPLTPQEELFSKLFNHEKVLVSNMDTLTLRAHREELATIAFEARARLTAVDDEEKGRKKKTDNGKPTGFSRSINADDTATAAINAVKDRQKKLTKKEKLLEGLVKLGYSQADAEKKLTAGTLLGHFKSKDAEKNVVPTLQSDQGQDKEITITKPIFNPFEKK